MHRHTALHRVLHRIGSLHHDGCGSVAVVVFVVDVLFLLEIDLDAFEPPIDEDDDGDGYERLFPHAIAAEASYAGGAPYRGCRAEPVDGQAVLHDHAGSEESYASDHLRKDSEVVVVHRSAIRYGGHDDGFGYQDEDAGTDGDQRVGGEACLVLLQLALSADDDAGD